ncbi:transporter substrate-binding domain-containing protein [Galbibacter sp. PAP.153]|uniref:transporter substrate-binding domain-containing protein n=1 Tax=Galbibacter sp. PAP.153 TaxID=3104623 RepID=UPI00300869E5
MRFSFVLLFLTFSVSLFSQNSNDSIVRVGYGGSEPFVYSDDSPTGIIVDLWRELAFNENLKYKLYPYKNIDSGLNAVKNNAVDVFIGPTTINAERAEQVTFSQPYFDTEMAILAPVLDLTLWERIQPFFSKTFLFAVLGLLFVLTIVGVLFWFAEGKYMAEEYGKSIVKGIGNGIWLAIVTMTTVGYGDYAPKTVLGRFIIGSWMIISLIMATSFVAGIATTLSITSKEGKTISSLTHLENKKVAVPSNPKLIDNIHIVGGETIVVNNVQEGYDKLMDGNVDALVYDVVPLEHIFDKGDKEEFLLSKKEILPQHYGLAFPEANVLKKQIDIEILRLKESGEIKKIIKEWIYKD